MLDGNDKNTFHAIRILRDVIDKGEKPIIIWLGAGVSRWCGFPTWSETAEHLHKRYVALEAGYDRQQGFTLVQETKFPEFFEYLHETNQQRYNRELVSLFTSRAPTPVYARFLKLVQAIKPLSIITTNVDENLEHNIPAIETIQRSNLERCPGLLTAGSQFVAKLHGSVSSIESLVFKSTDYRNLLSESGFLTTMRQLFSQATVIFVGYSLRDQYILNLITENCEARPLFGDGPHFAIQSTESQSLPESIQSIRYLSDSFADHRSAMIVLDIVRVVKDGSHVWFAPQDESAHAHPALASAYLISDIIPAGTWTSSQSLVLGGSPGQALNAIVGQGFEDSELATTTSPAMHDLTVGLVAFDFIYFPLSYAGAVHNVVGPEIFWELVNNGVFRFIHFELQPIMMFGNLEEVAGGDIGWMHLSVDGGRAPTVHEEILRQIRPVPGKEAEAERLLEALNARVSKFDHSKFNVPSLTRGALLHPSVRRLLGISDAILPTSMPRWATFPVIRLAHTIMIACACEDFALGATKVGFGTEVLVGAAFAVSAARDWTESVCSYVVTNRFDTDLGAYVELNPSVFRALLTFRDTQAAVNLRREILEELATNAGAEFVASVNGGLRHVIPSDVMQMAHDQLSSLLLRTNSDTGLVPAVWTNTRNSDSIVRLWRARSKRRLSEYCKSRGIRDKDPCPCGSGDRLRYCCAEALRC
jgi:hypothetical protein